MTKTIRTPLVALSVVALLVGCPSSSDDDFPPSDTPDGGPTDNDGASPGPGCGRLTTPCANGENCDGALDCQSGSCRDGKCQEVNPANGVKDGDETDVDCGGTKAPACDDGKGCAGKEDCKSGVCTGGVCQVPSPTDGIKNGDETDVDCGGTHPQAPPCATGKGCLKDADCDKVLCDTTVKKCKGASDDDKIKNGDETGIDCGGPTTPKKCPPGQGCAADADCDNTRCNLGVNPKVCDPPTSTDGLKNGTETDVDCGGGAPTNAPGCAEGLTCVIDTDCADPFCSFSKKCVTGRSCKGAVGSATAGIITCGKRETADATKEHESCCHSLPLPTLVDVRLDKYEVTAGRFRQFIESVGPNVRQWVANEEAGNTAVWQRLANDLTLAGNADMRNLFPASATPGEALNLAMQIGMTVMDLDEPSMSQGCYQDYVDVNNGAYGANTYYWDHNTLKAHLGDTIKPRRFSKAQYDEKPINCAPYWLYAAFCAWDGGRLPTTAEMNDAWGATNYPWGTATYTFPTDPGGNAYEYEQTANYYNNIRFFYHYPDYGDARDLAGYIGGPGRFILDKTANTSANGESWMDLGANVMEVTRHTGAGNRTFCDASIPAGNPNLGACTSGGQAGVIRATGLPTSVWVGGSWEGHRAFSFSPAAEPWFRRNSYTLATQTQYGKLGVRCAR